MGDVQGVQGACCDVGSHEFIELCRVVQERSERSACSCGCDFVGSVGGARGILEAKGWRVWLAGRG